MSEQRALQDLRGLRFPFAARAEVILEKPTHTLSGHITELSFRGCFVELAKPLQEKQHVLLKIYHSEEFFEAPAEVIYVRPDGAGLVFGNMKPVFRQVLQGWILSLMDKSPKS
jgi:PilZ domain-containing protein